MSNSIAIRLSRLEKAIAEPRRSSRVRFLNIVRRPEDREATHQAAADAGFDIADLTIIRLGHLPAGASATEVFVPYMMIGSRGEPTPAERMADELGAQRFMEKFNRLVAIANSGALA